MYPPSRDQYQSFLSAEWGVTHFFGIHLDEETGGRGGDRR